MEFCPTCANMLLFELPYMNAPARYFCPTCPYVAQIEKNVQINKHIPLVKKPIDPIIPAGGGGNLPKTSGVSCQRCGHGEAYFSQSQTRSADEPMTVFYRCTECDCNWIEN